MSKKAAIALAALAGAGLVPLLAIPSWSQITSPPRTKDPALSAQSFVAMLAQASTLVVHGKVISVRSSIERISGDDVPFLIAEIQPIEVLKGPPGPSPLEVRDMGGAFAANRGITFSDAVSFDPAAEIIVFLEQLGPNDHRYWSPVALRRGKFTVVSIDPRHRAVFDDIELAEWRHTRRIPKSALKRPLELKPFLSSIRHIID